MRTRDFSAAPPLARAGAMVTITPPAGTGRLVLPRWLAAARRSLRRSPGWVRSELLLGRAGVIAWYDDPARARSAAAAVPGSVVLHVAEPDGYSNGVWRAEDGRMAHIEQFTALPGETDPPTVARAGRSSPQLDVVPVRTRRDLRAFLDLPDWDPRRSTHAVPLWHSTVRRWASGRGPHRPHGAVELYLVRDRAGRVRARSTLHTDDRMDARLGEPALLLGATDFADRDALAAIVRYAEREARSRGRTRLLGPVSLLPNQVGGVVTDNVAEPSFVDAAWNPEHQPADWEGLGFTRAWPGATWRVDDLAGLDPDALFPGTLPEGVVLRHGSRRRLKEQLPVLRRMLNASFAELGYYTHIDADELTVQTDGLAHLLDERLLLWLEQDGEPVAFTMVIPDLTDFVRSTGGPLTPVDAARLWLTRGRHRRDAVLIVKGTVPHARRQGLMRHLSRELLRGLQDGGYRRLSVTFIEHDNAGSQAQFVAMGGRPLHGTCFYTKAVPPDGNLPAESPAARLLARAGDWGRAPSAHNTQPWRVRAIDGHRLAVGWHADRELADGDPTRRDLLLALGAVALSLRVTAQDLGLRAEVRWAVDVVAREAAVLTVGEGAGQPAERPVAPLPWTVEDLRARRTARSGFPQAPTAEQVAELGARAGLAGPALLVLRDDLVDELLPAATARTLTGPSSAELAGWLRLSARHPRHDLDGLSAEVLGLSPAEARGMALLGRSGALRRGLAVTGLDRLVARLSGARPRGTVVALAAPADLGPDAVADLGQDLLGLWLAGQRDGWSSHPLSELLDDPAAASRLHADASARLGRPVQVYAVWRWGRPEEPPPRSPRLTD